MTKQSTASKVENLAQEAASLPAKDETSISDQMSELLTRLAAENDAMKKEMHVLNKRFQQTMKMGKDELKAEIVHHPVQSVLTAFALGFVASLVLRR